MATDPTIGVEERDLDDAALEALAEAYATPAPAALRARVLAIANPTESGTVAADPRVRRARIVGAVAAMLALVLGGLLTRELQRGRERSAEIATLVGQNGALAVRIDEQGRALAGLREAFDAQAEVLRLVGGPRVMTATLAPQAGVTGAGRVLVDAGTGDAAIVLSGLAPADAGKTYELWVIRGKNAPEPAGLIAVADARGGAIRVPKVPRPSEVTAFAVSIEPHGGSPAPTGPVILVGPVAG
ncbi:MAG: anti-sigma factor [Candidatus Binatia bacterium]